MRPRISMRGFRVRAAVHPLVCPLVFFYGQRKWRPALEGNFYIHPSIHFPHGPEPGFTGQSLGPGARDRARGPLAPPIYQVNVSDFHACQGTLVSWRGNQSRTIGGLWGSEKKYNTWNRFEFRHEAWECQDLMSLPTCWLKNPNLVHEKCAFDHFSYIKSLTVWHQNTI